MFDGVKSNEPPIGAAGEPQRAVVDLEDAVGGAADEAAGRAGAERAAAVAVVDDRVAGLEVVLAGEGDAPRGRGRREPPALNSTPSLSVVSEVLMTP